MMDQTNQPSVEDRGIVLPLQGRVVARCYVDSAFGIQFFEPGPEATIRIGGRFLLRSGHEQHALWPEGPRRNLGSALDIFGKAVSAAIAYDNGTLEVRFADGTELSVPVDPDFEAWELVGPGDLRIVSLPAGGLATWGAQALERI